MRVLTAEESRRFDRAALERGVTGLELMDTACDGAFDWIQEVAAEGPLLVVCGPGNNGGDGLGLARRLRAAGREVTVLLGSPKLSTDAEAQRAACEEARVDLRTLDEEALEGLLGKGRPWVVDAMFGTGLNRALEAPWSDWVDEINRARAVGRSRGVLAVDLPSGLDADLATPIGPHVTADATVTFAAAKPACVLSPNAEACGAVRIVSLGFDPDELVPGAQIERVTQATVGQLLPRRPPGGHKGTFGHLLVVGGSRGMSGAVALAARSALRSGAGLVTVAAPGSVADRVEGLVTEALTRSLAADQSQSLAMDAAAEVLDQLEAYDALALGPGVGASGVAREVARRITMDSSLPLVLDADGLNAFGGRLSLLSERSGATVLTPHPGELARLLEWDRDRVVGNPLSAARAAVEACGQVVVLKGAASVVGAPDKPLALVREGNSGMATAGSGDVLTGILGAVLAQGMRPWDAARVAVWVHGATGTEAAGRGSQTGLIAGDIIEALPATWRRFEGA